MNFRTVGARALLAASALSLSAAGLAQAATTPGTIRWDQYAVPHIYGADIPTVVRGLGYAQMENHAETLLNTVAHARGRYAEYFGAGTSNANIIADARVIGYGIPARAYQWVAQGGAFQQQVLQAFCDGVNEYATKHPADILPQLRPILPVYPADVAMGEQNTIWFTFLPEQDGDPGLIAAWQSGGMAAARALQRTAHPVGSNGWALRGEKTADGNPTLMGNPHLPWGVNQPVSNNDTSPPQIFGLYQWIEANLIIGDPNNPTLNASGVTFVGGPFIGLGFNDYLGWTHTNNTIKNADLYELTLDSTGQKYLYGGTYLPLQHKQTVIRVLQADGVTKMPQVIDTYASIHGAVVAFNSGHTKALALRVPGLDQPSLVTQYWDMILSKNVTDFMAAESMLQMPFFNTMYADRNDNVFYLFGGRQPVRTPGTTYADYAGILNGSDPTQLWTKTLTFAQLPQALNPPGNFVANSNNPPWTSAFPQPTSLDPANYPTYIAPNFMDFRPQHGALFLTLPFKLSAAQILAAKMSTEMLLADRILADLQTAVAASSDTTAKAAAAILATWNHAADAPDVGGVLFESWWNHVVTDVAAGLITPDTSNSFYSPHPAFRTPWDPAHPLTTPVGLDPINNSQLVADLTIAYNETQTRYPTLGGASVKWGDAHKTTLVTRAGPTQSLVFPFLSTDPLSGTDDPFGPLRVVNPNYISQLGYFISYGGDGYVQVIEFTPTGATGGTLLTYGNASRPYSPHITDQLPFFDSKTLRPALRTLTDVQNATVFVETY